MAQSMLWYDLETFGTHPRWDRIGQYAAIRTDEHFEQIGEPTVRYCRMSPDYVPTPESCLVTGLTPQYVNRHGIREAELAELIFGEMRTPGTCVVGFNNLRFDDEFIRSLLYRNFIDPYVREYADGNSRWDLVDLARMSHDLRPEGIEWVYDEQGRPVFRLEALTRANGIEPEHAHDALSDVRSTIALGKLFREKQPKLFDYYYGLRRKDEVRRRLNLQNPQPLVHTSVMFTRPGGCTSIVWPISVHPDNHNQVIVYDLRYDPRDWLSADAEEIRRRVFSSSEELEAGERVWLKTIHINRSPAIAPLSTLSDERARALEIDTDACLRHAELLRGTDGLIGKVRDVFRREASRPYRDPELQLYSGGFFGDEDQAVFERIRNSDPQALVSRPPQFTDSRGPELLRRYVGRNYYEVLPEQEQRRWMSFCAGRLLAPELEDALDYGRFRRKVENMLGRTDVAPAQKAILRELRDYADWLSQTVLRSA